MMECQYLRRGSTLARRWHLLRCRECRAAQGPDAVLRRGIERLNAEPAPADGLAAALAVFGAAPVAPRARSRRWHWVQRWRLLPAGTLTGVAAIGAMGWLAYIDRDPVVKIPTPIMPSPNAYEMLAHAVKAIPSSEKTITLDSTSSGDYSRSEIGYALTNLQKKNPHPVGPERKYASEEERRTHHVYTLKEKEALLSRYSQVLPIVRRSFAYSYQAPPVRSFQATMPYFADYRQLARVLTLEAQVKAARGDYGGAASSSLDAMDLGAQISHGSGLIGFHVGLACSSIGRAALWPVIDRLDGAQARAVARRIERITERQVPVANAIQEEKWMTLASLQEMFQTPDWRRNIYTAIGETQAPPTAAGFAYYVLLLPYSKQAILNDFARAMDSQIAYTRMPNPRTRPWSSDPFFAEQALDQRAMRNPVVRMIGPAVSPTRYSEVAGPQTQNALLMVSLALRAFELEHGRLPRSLYYLISPKYLNHVPADPFRPDQPLCYRDSKVKLTGADGRQRWVPCLYSVGPDGVDNGGRAIRNTPDTLSDFSRWSQADRVREYGVKPDSLGDVLAGINTNQR